MQSSRKDRAPLPAPRTPGSFALWPNAIRLRPNEHSSRWATIHAGAKAAINLSRSFGEGLLARMTKDEARARTAFEAARAQQEKIVQAQPDYGPALCVLGIIDAALGRKDLALDEGRRAIALTPVEKDVVNGSRVLQYFAITAAWAGDKELALQQLEAGLRAPAASLMLSYGALKLLPFWDPLRGDPRFEKIVASLAPKESGGTAK